MYVMNPQDVPLEYPDGQFNHAEERPWRRRSTPAPLPTASERFDQAAPLIGAPPVYGPPVALVAGAWLVLVLLLIPPAAFLITLALAVAVPVAALAAIVAPPYLLVRRLHARHSARRRAVAAVHGHAPPAPAHSESTPSAEAAGPRGWRPAGAHLVPLTR
jgi:hypothetical protein